MAFNNDGSPSGYGTYDGYPFPPTGSYGSSSNQKADGPSGGFWSPGAAGFPLESPSSSMPWYFNPMRSPFNFNHAFAMSDAAASSSSTTGNQPSYFPPFPPQQPAGHNNSHNTNTFTQQPDPHHQPTSFHSTYPQQTQPYQQSQPHQQALPLPLQQHSSQPANAHPSSSTPHSFMAPPPPGSYTHQGPPARASAFALPSGPLRLSAVASSVPPALIRDNSSSTRSSYSSGSSATSSQPSSAHLLPMCVDMSLVDGSSAGHKPIPAAEVKMEDEEAGSDPAIHAFELGTASSRRSSRNPTVTYEDIDAEGDEDEDEDEDEEEPASEGESIASSSSSYHDGRQRANGAAGSTKRKIKQPKQPLPTSASAKSSPTTSAAAAKRRASAPSHLQHSQASSRAPSPPPSPIKRVRMAPSSASVAVHPIDDLSLPPLPADFDSYGPGGSSRFTDDGSGGGIAIPDFSGREDCWGIGKEAYQQLSAKAKKQLRNKLGARRFRERRKEYITTLEERIAGRDEIITQTRDRLRDSIQLVKELQAKVQSLEQSPSS